MIRPAMTINAPASRRDIFRRTFQMTAVSVALSVGLCVLGMSAFVSPEAGAGMTVREQWTMAITMSALIPAVVAPVVVWRIQSLMEALDRANIELARLAATDQLTGLLNRRGFEDAAEALLHRAAATRSPVAALMCDIDHFKTINDTHGHAFGDQAIRHVARLIADKQWAPGAIAGRHGGEEFAILLPGASTGQAKLIAEQLRVACGLSPVEWNGASARVTISVGVISSPPIESGLSQLLKQADHALYAAKRGGRNQVVAGPVEPVSDVIGESVGAKSA